MRFQNPVVPGFYPDPSVCRVGQDYYLVTSSFEYFPGVPLFHSRDLVHWKQIGHCLTRKSQLFLEKAVISGGIFAPTLRHHDGRFYMVTTNSTRGGNFFVHAEDPAGPWSDPVWVDQAGIDPSLFFDDDGKVYFTNAGFNATSQSVIDLKTGKKLTESRDIWRGTGGRYPEAPHLYKINGSYYLMLAEGGTEYGHMVTISRSKSPWGPFEPCPKNPLLTHRDRGAHPIQATGHADLVQAQDGTWWAVFLGIRPQEEFYHHLGRETFLAPVSWDQNGWPLFNQSGTVELEMDGPDLPPHPFPSEPGRDDFNGPAPGLRWNFLRNPYDRDWSLTERPGWLTLKGSAVTLDDLDSPAFLGRRQQHFRCTASALLDFQPKESGEEAGLTVFMNARHHYEIAVTLAEGRRCVMVRRRIGDLAAVAAQKPLGDGPLTLQVRAEPDKYTFSYSLGASPAETLATGLTRYLSKEVAGGFTGVYFGLYATGNGKASRAPAGFDWFEYKEG